MYCFEYVDLKTKRSKHLRVLLPLSKMYLISPTVFEFRFCTIFCCKNCVIYFFFLLLTLKNSFCHVDLIFVDFKLNDY